MAPPVPPTWRARSPSPPPPLRPLPIEYEGPDDPLDPQNLPMWKKWCYALSLGLITLTVTFASSIFSTATQAAADEFGVSNEVMTLGTALFIAGFSVGPMIYGPMLELWGRKRPLFAGHFLFIICQIPVGVAQNVETIMLFRFLGGVTSAGPLAITSGWFADFFDPVQRGLALCVLSGTTLIGPIQGPILGGFMTQSYLGWRWTAWMTMILACLFGLIGLVILPETYAPILLTRKARKLRLETRNWALHSKHEESALDIGAFITKYLNRPFRMLLLEPILVLITLYMTFIYGLIYLLFEAWPISFIEQRGYNEGVGALPFISIGVGVALGSSFVAYITYTRIMANFKKNGYVIPEDRLYPMMFGAIIFPIGVFWFAWTSFPTINPWPQILAGVPIGAGVQIIYLQGLAYIVDVYTVNANSATSANAIVRSIVAAGFVMFAAPMYHNLGVQWATSLLAFLGVAFIPVPFLFYIYGAKIRKWSRYSVTT
ncbi:hypothetical protein VTN77DRAFT_1449 [Rasamsonia byssochlamydoides]|uniref:uncharacterized protein n=1 Tax=Rasamsonia byssochlamydoides TaxID=89139 RepID=UPI003742E198